MDWIKQLNRVMDYIDDNLQAEISNDRISDFHGVLPSVVKKESVMVKSCPKLSFQITVKGANKMNYQIERWPAFKAFGISNRIKTNEAFEFVPQIWEKAWKDGTMQKFIKNFPDYRPAGFLGIAAGGEWGNSEEMDYILAVTNYVDTPDCDYIPVPDGMTEFTYPAATWAIINADGELPSAVQEVYTKFYSEWLPGSGYKLSDLPVIECYMQENRQEVWIAIEETEKQL